MRRALVLALLAGAAPAGADDEPIPAQALDALRGTVAQIDGWVDQATALEGRLQGLQGAFDTANEVQDLLDLAVAGRDTGRLAEAIGKVDEDWAEIARSPSELKAFLVRKGLGGFTGPLDTLEDRLLAVAHVAKEHNGRVLSAWERSGLGGHVQRALDGKGPLGSAVRLGRDLRARVDALKERSGVGKYLETLDTIDGLFKPTARSAYSGLESIQRILSQFKDRAPPPVDAILGGYADVVGGFIDALKRVEDTINTNARQMVLTRSGVDSGPIVEALLRRRPDANPHLLTERRAPPYVPAGTFYEEDGGNYYLWVPPTMYWFAGSLADIRRCARMLEEVHGSVTAAALDAGLVDFHARIDTATRRFDAEFRAFQQVPVAHVTEYLNRRWANDPDMRDHELEAVRTVLWWARADADTWLAHLLFDPAGTTNVEDFGHEILHHALVDVTVTGADVAPGSVSVWASEGLGRTFLVPKDDGHQGILGVFPGTTRAVTAGGLHAEAEIREAQQPYAPPLPWFRFSLRAERKPEPEPEEPGDGAGVDLGALEGANEAGEDGEDGGGEGEAEDDGGVPGVSGGSEDDPTGGGDGDDPLPPEDVEGMEEEAGEDTDPTPPEHETNETFGGRPEGVSGPLYDEFFDALLEGDRPRAIGTLQRMTGANRERAEAAVNELLGEEATVSGSAQRNAGLDQPWGGDPPPPDADFVRGAGVDFGTVGDRVRSDVDLDGPGRDDLAPPDPGDPAAGDRFGDDRRRAGDAIRGAVQSQTNAVGRARADAAAAVRNHPVPTRGGMQPIDIGGATEIVISVWDSASEDGDRVAIYVGGQCIVADLTLLNAPRHFRVGVGGDFTAVKVLALNVGTAPPNTAAFSVSAGGRRLSTGSWSVGDKGMASTVIRRSR